VAGVAQSANELLASLIDKDIETVTGRWNRVLGLDGDQVIVATTRSPAGQRVPITWVQEALERLRRDGSIEISVESVKYRSAFIGAVLSQLPGTEVDRSTSPPRIKLRRR
jgi:hypothetical protein